MNNTWVIIILYSPHQEEERQPVLLHDIDIACIGICVPTIP